MLSSLLKSKKRTSRLLSSKRSKLSELRKILKMPLPLTLPPRLESNKISGPKRKRWPSKRSFRKNLRKKRRFKKSSRKKKSKIRQKKRNKRSKRSRKSK
jgi:hypothetical protein